MLRLLWYRRDANCYIGNAALTLIQKRRELLHRECCTYIDIEETRELLHRECCTYIDTEETCELLHGEYFANIDTEETCELLHRKCCTYIDTEETCESLHREFCAYIDTEETCESVEVILVPGHLQDFGNHSLLGPVHPKLLHQLLQIDSGSVPDGKHCKIKWLQKGWHTLEELHQK